MKDTTSNNLYHELYYERWGQVLEEQCELQFNLNNMTNSERIKELADRIVELQDENTDLRDELTTAQTELSDCKEELEIAQDALKEIAGKAEMTWRDFKTI